MPIVLNDLLGKPGPKIYQDTELFNFSLDSILLADFVSVNYKTKSICDLCSGNAPIPIYLTLRTNAKIVCVEVQEESYNLAKKSIEYNKLDDQISLVLANLKDINQSIGKHTFDVVTCNPPFFKIGENHVNPNDKKAIARHELLASLEDIIKEASSLLNSKGRFAMVHRPDRLIEIFSLMQKYKIEPKRLRFVYPKINKECHHILIEGIKDGSLGGLRILPPLYVYNNDNKWTEEVLKIYNNEKE